MSISGSFLEVRCCCNPNRLYGWLPEVMLPPSPRIGSVVRFMILPSISARFESTPLSDPAGVSDYLVLDRLVNNDSVNNALYALKYDREDITPKEKLARLMGISAFIRNPRALIDHP